MDDKKNPEITAEEGLVSDIETTAEEAVSEAAEETSVENEEIEGIVKTEAENLDGDNDLAIESETIEEFDESDDTLPETIADMELEELEEAKKKRFPLQVPIIIAACILVAALLGYFVFTGFILKEPEGVTWSTELDGATYYFDFNNDGTFKAYVGSVEIDSTFQKSKSSDGNTLTVGTNVCNFYSGTPATYTISGSRILGNQTLDYSYGEGYDFSLNQASRKETNLDLPKDFTPDEDLLGTWVFQYYGYDIYKATFNDDGSMKLQFIQDGITYNGTYTIEDDNINFTYYVSDSVAAPLQYSVDGDTLNFLGAAFVREGSEATPDQALQVPQDN